MEVAALGLKIETQGIDGANKALDKLVGLADRAEKAVTGLEAAADSAGKKTRELDKGASGAAEATRELDKGASGAANSTKALDTSAGSAAKSTGALDKGASSAAKSTEALDKGAGKADKSTKGMGDSAGKATTQVDEMGKKAASTERGVSSFASAAVKAGALLAAAFSVSAISKYADAWSEMQNKLRLVTDSTDSLAAATDQVYGIAQKTSQGIDTVSQVYQRFAQNSGQLGLSLKQVAGYTETVAKAVATSGASAQSANAALVQFGQGIASGALRGEELNSVMEQTPSLAMAIAKGLDMPIGQLKKFAGEGKLTSQVVLQALGKVSGYVDEQFSKRVMTIGQGFTNLTNSATRFVGMIDSKSGASAAFAAGLVKISSAVDKTTDFLLALGTALAPAFNSIGAALSTVGENATVVGVALAGFAAPTLIGGVASLAAIISGALLTGLRAVTAVMLANPLGLFVAGLATAGYAAYKFRDDIKKSVGVDVAEIAKTTVNVLIGSFVAAYEDIKFVWNNFGDMMGAAVIGGINIAIRSINFFIQGAISGVNNLIEAINKIPGVDVNNIGKSVGIGEVDNPYAGRLGASVDLRNAAVNAAMSRDYVGDISKWFEGIGSGSGSGTGGGSGGGGAGAGGKSARTVAIEAETDAIKRALKDQVSALDAANEQNDYIYGLGIKSAEEYYSRKAELGRDIGLAEAAAAEKEIEVVNRALAANKLTEDQRKKLLEDRRKLIGDVAMATIKAFAAEVSAEEAAARKRTSLQSEATKAAQSATASAIDQANALALQVEQYGMTATAIADANVARAEEDLALAETTRAMAIMRGERAEDITLIEKEIESIKQRAVALRSVSGSTAKLEVLNSNKEFAEEAKKQNEQIGESLTDALLRGFEDGKGFAQNFKDTMVNLFKTMVLKPIIQPIAQGAANVVTSALGLGGSSGGGGGAASLLGTASNLNTAYGALTGGLTSSLAGGIASIGSAIGSSAVSSFALGMQASLPAGMVGPTLAGAGGAAGLGASFAGALPYIGAAVAGISLLTGLLGNKSKPGVGNYGLADITSSGASAASDDSLFFGDRRGFQGQSQSITSGLTALGDQISAAAKIYGGDATGLRLYAQTAYSPDGKGSSGGTAIYGRDGQQVFGSSFSGTNEQMSEMLSLTIQRSLLGGLKESNLAPQFANVLNNAVDIGTATAEQLTQISAALESVRALHASFDAMSSTFPTLTALGWESREALVAAAGGLDEFTGNLNTYYGAFYSEAERTANSLTQMRTAAAQLGVALPDTREGFRALVESQDLTTASGQRTYAALIAMSGQFDAWATSSKNAADAVIAEDKRISDQRIADAKKDADLIASILSAARDAAETQANGALNTLTRAVNVQKNALTKAWEDQQKVLQDGIDTASTALSEHQALSQRVKATLQNLFGQTDLAMQRSVAQSQISDALASARSGGPLPTAASLESAFGVIAQPSQQLFRTFEEYQLDFLKTANDIAALGELTDAQISVEERTLNVLKEQLIAASQAYKAQIDYYDSMLTKAQEQIDAALGNTQATLTVSQAMTAFTASIANLVAAQATKPKPTNGAPSGLSSGEQAVWDAYQGSGIGYLDQGGWEFWNEAIKNGADPAAIAAEIAAINAGKVNGSHANGLDRVPFDGYTAILHEGERVKTKQQARDEDMQRARSAGNGGVQDAESLRILQQLLMRVNDMGADTRAIAQNTGRWARLSERWDGDGLPPTRDEMV